MGLIVSGDVILASRREKESDDEVRRGGIETRTPRTGGEAMAISGSTARGDPTFPKTSLRDSTATGILDWR